jgi:hypothetical protein
VRGEDSENLVSKPSGGLAEPKASLELEVKELVARLARGRLDEKLPKVFIVVKHIKQLHLQSRQHFGDLLHLGHENKTSKNLRERGNL